MDDSNVTSANQYLTFTLGDEFFALEIAKVREVLDYTTITHVPRMPQFLRGVINLRGNVVPVIDLKLHLGLGNIQRTVDTCIVIVELNLDGEEVLMGALADSVQEVIDLEPSDISQPPRIGTRLNTNFIKGMGKHDEKFIIILDIDNVLSSEELKMVQSAGQGEGLELAETGRREAVGVQ